MASPIGGKSGGASGKGKLPPEDMSAYERWVLPNMETTQEQEEFAIASAIKRKAGVTPSVALPPAPEETVAPLTAEDVEAIRQAAYDEGYQEGKDTGYKEGKEQGHKQGYDEGYKSGQDEVRAISLRLSQICRVLLEPIPANDDKLEEVLKQLVTTICTQVVRRELMIDASGVTTVVKEALECMQPGNKRIRIHLNPNDVDIVERELRNLNQWENQWRLLAHRTITPGGCIIDTDDSIVDARAEKRLAAILHQVYTKDPSALTQDATPRDSLAQVFSEVPAFAGNENDDTPASTMTSSSEASEGETARQTRSEGSSSASADSDSVSDNTAKATAAAAKDATKAAAAPDAQSE